MSQPPGPPSEVVPQVSERRAWVRHRPRRPQLSWSLLGAKPPELRTARVQDISARGIGLLLDRSVPSGSVLALRFAGTPFEARPILVRVKYSKAVADDEFQAGGTFVVPLNDEQLAQLVV
jgi:hypothetical protein